MRREIDDDLLAVERAGHGIQVEPDPLPLLSLLRKLLDLSPRALLRGMDHRRDLVPRVRQERNDLLFPDAG